VEDEILAEGAQIIWVLEQGRLYQDGTAEECRTVMDQAGATGGWCVGDDETQPDADAWDDSVFSIGRGFDIIVTRRDMVIQYTTSHGTPAGNENLSGQDVLEAIRDVVAGL
jgi:hypothetical protein